MSATAPATTPHSSAEARKRKAPDEWDCGRMEISVATSLTNNTLVVTNFSDTIGHGKQVPIARKRDDTNCFWLNHEWTENTEAFRAKVLIPYFVAAAARSGAGFRICGSWYKKENAVTFNCTRGRVNDSEKNKMKAAKRRSKKKLKNPNAEPVAANRKSQRPSKKNTREDGGDPDMPEDADFSDAETCKHVFRVFWDDGKARWFVPKKQAGCRRHNGHPRRDCPHLRMIQPRRAVPAEEMDVAETALDNSEIGTVQTAALVQLRKGVHLGTNATATGSTGSMHRAEEMDAAEKIALDGNIGTGQTQDTDKHAEGDDSVGPSCVAPRDIDKQLDDIAGGMAAGISPTQESYYWGTYCCALTAYILKYGHPPRTREDHPPLYDWMQLQKNRQRQFEVMFGSFVSES